MKRKIILIDLKRKTDKERGKQFIIERIKKICPQINRVNIRQEIDRLRKEEKKDKEEKSSFLERKQKHLKKSKAKTLFT